MIFHFLALRHLRAIIFEHFSDRELHGSYQIISRYSIVIIKLKLNNVIRSWKLQRQQKLLIPIYFHCLLRHCDHLSLKSSSHVINVTVCINCTKRVHEGKLLSLNEFEIQLLILLIHTGGHPRFSFDCIWICSHFQLSCRISRTRYIHTHSNKTKDLSLVLSIWTCESNLLVVH
jgi:hypothetical protein